MQRFVIERNIPGIGGSSAEELAAVTEKSNGVIAGLGGRVQWVQSYVADDKMYCVYLADDADAVREHARRGGFPADVVAPVAAVVDPVMAGA